MNDQTKVPIRWVFALLSSSGAALILAMSSIFWLSGVANTAENAKDGSTKNEIKLDKTVEALQSIDRRLANIEGALGVKK